MPAHSVAALVMAAGRSTRMAPANKLLLRDASGRATVARVASACVASLAEPVVVVTGHEAEAVREAAGTVPGLRFVHAPDYAQGLSASLRAGLEALPAQVGGVLVCLGDMPLVGPAVLDGLVRAYDPGAGRGIVVPVWQDKRGNPVLWGQRFFGEMMALSGDRGARALLDRHPGQVFAWPAPDAGVLVDVDTLDDLAALEHHPARWVYPSDKDARKTKG